MATLVRWEPFRELAALQNDMGRLMSTFLGEGQPGGENGQRSWMPAVDVWEDENELVYAFDLPGIPEDKISVEYDEGALTVSGERVREETTEGDRFYRFERRFGLGRSSAGFCGTGPLGRTARFSPAVRWSESNRRREPSSTCESP